MKYLGVFDNPGQLVQDWISLTLPHRALIACFSLATGLILSGYFDILILFFGVMMLILIYASQAIYNNILDYEADKINAPDRPLPRGAISMKTAWAAYWVLIFFGLLSAFLASPLLVPAALLLAFIGYIYSKYTKGLFVLSYITLTISHMCVPLLFGYAINAPIDATIFTIIGFVFLANFIAVSVKDYKDVEGDRAVGLKTLPVLMGVRNASYVTFFGFFLLALIFWIPWYFFGLSLTFMVAYGVIALLRLIYGYKLLRNPSPNVASGILKNFRYLIMLEMVAWWLG